MTTGYVEIKLSKEKIKEAAKTANMMMGGGSLYPGHPIVELLDEMVNECLKLKKKKK
jgi:hypothetical protein